MGADQGLVSPSDIADIAGVSRGAVSNWRKRAKDDFPKPVAGTQANPLFSRQEITKWLISRGYEVKEDSGEISLWAAMNLVRGELTATESAELVLELAAARKVEASDSGRMLEMRSGTLARIESGTRARVSAAVERVGIDDLASAADFVLERLARSQGKTGAGAEAGFVGSRTATLLAKLAAARPGGVLYDPACGIGVALIEAISLGARPSRVIGHDVVLWALCIAEYRAALHDVDIEIARTNVLSEDIDPSLRADVILLEPPFGLRPEGAERSLTDSRFEFGTPPRTSADTIWVQHAVAHLTESGRAYVLTPPGPLFRGGAEQNIRTELVRRGCVEAIVGLPGKMLPHTAIPLALWVLRRPVDAAGSEKIFFIDASGSEGVEHRVAGWLMDPEACQDVPHAEVPLPDVLAAKSTLAPQRWVNRAEREPTEVANEYATGWREITDTVRKLQNVLVSAEHFAKFSKSRVMTVGDLLEQGVLQLHHGRMQERDQVPAELRDRIATDAAVRNGTLHRIGVEGDYPEYPELTAEGDVLVTTMNTVRAQLDEAGGHLPSHHVYRLRVLDRNVLSPKYLAIALQGNWNNRFQYGLTASASIRDLEIPLVPMDDQQKIRLSMLAISMVHDHSARLVRQSDEVGAALLDAVRYNAPLPDLASELVGGTGDNRSAEKEGGK